MVKTPVGLLVGVLALSLFYNVGVMLGNTVAIHTDDSPMEQQRQQLRGRMDGHHLSTKHKKTNSKIVMIPGVNFTDQGSMIPKCAQNVFITLHSSDEERSDKNCYGFLIRDDIILTTKECARYNFTFSIHNDDDKHHHESVAYPYTSLNEGISSRLGFLQTNATPHYYFIHEESV